MTDDESLLREFMSESTEHLARAESDLAVLAREGSSADGECVRRIFRAVHTIKGSCGFFGYARIGSVAHAMESLLDRLRDGRIQATRDVVAVLFEGLDRLIAMFSDIDRSNQQDVSELVARIRALAPRSRMRGNPDAHAPQIGGDPCLEAPGAAPGSHHLYRIHCDESRIEAVGGGSAILEKLSGIGLVHEEEEASSFDIGGDAPARTGAWMTLFSSQLGKELVAKATELPVGCISELRGPVAGGEVKTENVIPVDDRDPAARRGESVPQVARTTEGETREVEYLKVRLDILDKLMALAGELVLVRNQHLKAAALDGAEMRGMTQRLDVVASDLQETIMRTRMQPIGVLFGRFGKVVRDLGRQMGKEIAIESEGNDVELDKSVLEALVDPLTHIVRNACDHGIEDPPTRSAAGKPRGGTILLRACHEGGQITVEIRDDGRGVDRDAVRRKAIEKRLLDPGIVEGMVEQELLSLLFVPGFSTSEKVTGVSGRGVGMDVVKANIESLGGEVELASCVGKGTTIRLRLPLTLAIIPSMIVESCGQRFAIPQINLEELVTLYDDASGRIESAGNREVYRLRDRLLTIFHLRDVLERPVPFDDGSRRDIVERHRRRRRDGREGSAVLADPDREERGSLSFAVVKVGASRFGLVIDRIVGTEEIVVKPMHRALKDLPIYSGATVLGDGSVALILDVQGVARHGGFQLDDANDRVDVRDREERDEDGVRRPLLLFRNRPEEQLAMPLEVVRRIEHIEASSIERIGSREYVSIHGVSTRALRLDGCLELAPMPVQESLYAIIPKCSGHPYCILAPELVDSGEYRIVPGAADYRHPGVESVGLVGGRLTLVIRPDRIAHAADPGWFQVEAA